MPACESVRQVDVLSRAVEISAEGRDSRSSCRIFSNGAESKESFALEQVSLAQKYARRNRVSPDFLRGRSFATSSGQQSRIRET
jgi:hypothetical protein